MKNKGFNIMAMVICSILYIILFVYTAMEAVNSGLNLKLALIFLACPVVSYYIITDPFN